MDDINWRKGNIEVRTVNNFKETPYVELVKWNEKEDGRATCFTLAYFHKDSDGYVSLHFVGDRPFREIAEIDVNNVWKQLWLTCMMLEGKNE